MRLLWQGHSLDFSRKTHIMGVLNVTPDSFSDGGRYFHSARAFERGLELADEGADIIDVGGQSTRPGSEPVSVEEEIRRTVPLIETLSKRVGVPISIDTYRAEVAQRAIMAGAAMINDISGLRFDPRMASVAAENGVPVVLMHIRGTPRDMQVNPVYEALIPEIMDYLRESVRIAEAAGVRGIIVDPGIGFGKTFDHNLEIINNLEQFTMLERPLLVGPSRKAFLGKILDGAPPEERVEATAAAVAACVLKGADIVRVHDVRVMSRVVRVADAIKRERVRA
ncbi:MAG: dihydropteroate synthase [Thermodesulfovibrionales bacterium]